MKKLQAISAIALLTLAFCFPVYANPHNPCGDMDTPGCSRPSQSGPEEYFLDVLVALAPWL